MQEIRLHGRGGQGLVKASHLVVRTAVETGHYGQFIPFFGVERKGSPVFGFLRLSEEPIRRKTQVYTPDVLSFGDLELDRGGSLLSSVSGSVTLTRLEYRMLEALMLNRGIYLSTEELLVKVWGYESEAEQGAVWVYVSYLRRRLAAVGSRVRIQVKRGVGYRLEAPDA